MNGEQFRSVRDRLDAIEDAIASASMMLIAVAEVLVTSGLATKEQIEARTAQLEASLTSDAGKDGQ